MGVGDIDEFVQVEEKPGKVLEAFEIPLEILHRHTCFGICGDVRVSADRRA